MPENTMTGLEKEEPRTQDPAPQGAEPEPDWKALYEKAASESRKWEARAQKDGPKAKAYDELAKGERSIEDRLTALESENARLKNEQARSALVKQVAQSTGLSEEIVASLAGADEDELTAQARTILDAFKAPSGAPKAPEAGTYPKDAKQGGNEALRKLARQLGGL
ncbi:MAG: DUF4355 domain-containing protein [Atopobiaceae bacterium]|nr:DUF4355 domain-containing protein [Atopobiaceae bacterium]